MDKTLTAVMGGMFVLVMIALVAGWAVPPTPQYACPICGASFATYDELYQHFITEHPSEPIDIIWE